MEIRVFGLVLLMVLSVALPAEAQNWQAFKRKHIWNVHKDLWRIISLYLIIFLTRTLQSSPSDIIMEIHVFGLVWLLVLSVALPAEAQSWQAFRRKHIYLNMTVPDCTRKIEIEKINSGEGLNPTLQAKLACRDTNISLSQYITMTIHLDNLLCQQGADHPSCSSFRYREEPIATREERAELMPLGRTQLWRIISLYLIIFLTRTLQSSPSDIIMEIRVFSLVLLLVLSVALPAEAQNWQAFKRKHIYLNMDEPSCTNIIMEIRVFSLVLLLVLCVTLIAEAQNWQAFKRKHIYLKSSCTSRIKENGISVAEK
ncbi:hypothetical protein KOW79_021754 [Hemibagrus wyckioides]|uniref:Uncharacterized protein n=1 Tax=Hemibagrus wyckioides TaxID=337641 RepID=A0A9D3S7T7_9TELE|nr:hypothetical protein KOW79_021754 [Hemibagrus wyckioides]